jgi:hypothetical protein
MRPGGTVGMLWLFAGAALAQAPRTIRYPAVPAGGIVQVTAPSLAIASAECELNRVNGLVLQQSGGIVVSNAGELQLCYYSPAGTFIRKVGRQGAGPGEFASMYDVSLYRGDSIVVSDRMQRRVSIFGPAGEPGRQFPVIRPDTLGSHNTTIALASGDFLLSFSEVKTMTPRKEAVVFHQQFVRATPDGQAGPRVARLVQGEHFVQATPPEMGGTAYWSLHWGRSTSISAKSSGFVDGDGEDSAVREADGNGQVRVIHVAPLSRRPVTPQLIAAYRTSTIAAEKPERRAVTERMVNEMPFPREMPAYGRIIADDRGPVWVESYPDSSGSYWLRLDPATVSTKGYRFPARFRLLAVRGDRACGVGRDADDLQAVYCFTIPR